MKAKHIILLIAAGFTGALFFLWLYAIVAVDRQMHPESDPVAVTEPQPAPEKPAPTNTVARTSNRDESTLPDYAFLQEENERLTTTNAKLRKQLTDILNWILKNFKGKFAIPERQIANINIPSVTKDFMLHEDIAELLNINSGEEQLINDVFSYARLTINELQNERSTFSAPTADQTIIQIPPVAEDGEEVRGDVYRALEKTLGEDRFGQFMDFSGKSMNESFDDFGKTSRTIMFEMVYRTGSDAPHLLINDSRIVPVNDSQWEIKTSESLVQSLPEEYEAYQEALPENFREAVNEEPE